MQKYSCFINKEKNSKQQEHEKYIYFLTMF